MTTDIRTRTEPTDRGNYEVVTEAAALPAMLQRISWGAVLAGVVVALVTHLTLSMLGVSFGASAIDPLKEVDPLDPQLGTGVVIWMVASTLISLFAGGWVAGRLAGIPDGTDGVLHGLLTWAVVSLLTVFLLTTGIGNLLSGATRILGQGLTLAGEGVAALAPEAAEAVEEQSIALQSVLDEARTLLIAPSTATSATTPQTGAQTPGTTTQGDTVPQTGASQATTPAETDESSPTVPERRANLVIGRLLRLGVNATDEDRTAVVNLLVEQGGMTQEQAIQTVQRWEQTYQEAAARAEEIAREVGQRAADALSAVAGVAFIAMVVGAFAGGAGGLIGSPTAKMLPTVETEKETIRRTA